MAKIEIDPASRIEAKLENKAALERLRAVGKEIDERGHMMSYHRTNERLEALGKTWTARRCDHCKGVMLYDYGTPVVTWRKSKAKPKKDAAFVVEPKLEQKCDGRRLHEHKLGSTSAAVQTQMDM